MLLFNLYLGSGRKDDAIRLLDDLAKRTPSNASIFAMKAAVEKTQGNLAEAEVNYRKALEIDPTLDFAANNLAYLLVQDERDLQTAQTLAEGVRRRQPENPGVADTLGWIYFKKGLLVLARAQAQFAVDREPNNGVFQYHLGKIYMDIYRESKESSQRVKAVEALKKAAGSSAEFPERELAKADLQELQKPKL
jgi:predicted Zn-dependent protease